MTESTAEHRHWHFAISLVTAWRAADGRERRRDAVARRLAEAAAADGYKAVAEQAGTGLVALANMLLELYAGCADSSADAVLHEATTLRWDDGPGS